MPSFTAERNLQFTILVVKSINLFVYGVGPNGSNNSNNFCIQIVTNKLELRNIITESNYSSSLPTINFVVNLADAKMLLPASFPF